MPNTRRLPLAERLSLIITGVIVLVMSASLLLTYGALERSAEIAVSERLVTATVQFAGTVSQSVTARHAMLRELAANDSLVAALDSSADEAALARARTVLRRARRQPLDSGLPVELWSRDGRRVAWTGRDVDTTHDARTARTDASFPVRRRGLEPYTADDSLVAGALYPSQARVLYWGAVPVVRGGRPVGYIAEQVLAFGPPEAVALLRGLTGEDVRMLVHNADRSTWLATPGVPSVPRTLLDSIGHGTYAESPDGFMIAAQASVVGTPWMTLLEAPVSSVHARTRRELATLGGLGILLALAGGVMSFFLGKRIARPLAGLTTAAEAIAHGDYARRVPYTGDDEIGRLARSFNQMAVEVDSARSALQHRFDEVQAIAVQMERANEQLQRTMEEAERARVEAQHANQAKSDFLAVMSHELRTPLNAIGGYAQLIDLGVHGPITPAQHEALGRIARSQAHLLRLINDVLNFAQVDSGHVRYAFRDVPLGTTLGDLELLVAPQLQSKGLTLGYRPCDDAVTVHADEDKLKQIVLNLLSNAIKFTPEGGRIEIDCDGDCAPENVRVHVRDSGVGIPAERLEAIFDPFVQLDRTVHRSVDGVGLGLAISRDLARGMGGELEATSTVGEGSVFTLTLPTQPRGDRATQETVEATAGV